MRSPYMYGTGSEPVSPTTTPILSLFGSPRLASPHPPSCAYPSSCASTIHPSVTYASANTLPVCAPSPFFDPIFHLCLLPTVSAQESCAGLTHVLGGQLLPPSGDVVELLLHLHSRRRRQLGQVCLEASCHLLRGEAQVVSLCNSCYMCCCCSVFCFMLLLGASLAIIVGIARWSISLSLHLLLSFWRQRSNHCRLQALCRW